MSATSPTNGSDNRPKPVVPEELVAATSKNGSRKSLSVQILVEPQTAPPENRMSVQPVSPSVEPYTYRLEFVQPPTATRQLQQQSTSAITTSMSKLSMNSAAGIRGSDTSLASNQSGKPNPHSFVRAMDSDWFGEDDIATSQPDLSHRTAVGTSSSAPVSPPSGEIAKLEISPVSRSNSSTPVSIKVSGRVLPNVQKTEPAPHPTKLVVGQPKTKELTKKDSEEWVVVPPKNETVDEKTAAEVQQLSTRIYKSDRFKTFLTQSNVDLDKLKTMSWNGIPEEVREMSWKLLLGYLPTSLDRRQQTLTKKRNDYEEYVQQAYGRGETGLDHAIWHQIHIDVPRTHPGIPLFQNERIQKSLERLLYIWAIRHPASGYVQGINDLATPFYVVFLNAAIPTDVHKCDISKIPENIMKAVEADTFWCLSKLLDGIQDNYTHAQPGIHRQLNKMKEIISRIDAQLYQHLQTQGIEFLQFAFRWMNCLLMREMSLENISRMWDTYLAEMDGFSDFHVYVCAAFLAKWSEHIRKLEFQDIIMFLQAPPTKEWTEKDIELLLSEAYMWKSLFHNAPSHLANRVTNRDASGWSI